MYFVVMFYITLQRIVAHSYLTPRVKHNALIALNFAQSTLAICHQPACKLGKAGT